MSNESDPLAKGIRGDGESGGSIRPGLDALQKQAEEIEGITNKQAPDEVRENLEGNNRNLTDQRMTDRQN